MASRIPALLEPYLALPREASLILLTSVLGASSNWLTLRYLYSYLRSPARTEELEADDGDTGVVLVSFLRDGAFWRDGAARLGLDLDAMARAGRFVFVDGLTGLFNGEETRVSGPASKDRAIGKVGDVRKEIEAALGAVRSSRRVLIIDQLDVLLATSGDELTSVSLQNMVLSLRELVHTTILTLAADAPLLHAQATALEREHAGLVTSTAHAADAVLALRMLDTGSARDVSGVVRVTGGLPGVEEGGREYLYFVAGDGGVKVFERGA